MAQVVQIDSPVKINRKALKSLKECRSFSAKIKKDRSDYPEGEDGDEKYYNYRKEYHKDESTRRNLFVNNRVKEHMCPFYKS